MKGGWIILQDHLLNIDTTITGPHDSEVGPLDITAMGTEFKLYDDDNVLYYTGKMYQCEDDLAPLEDFGKPNAGCTKMKVDGEWV